MTSFILAISGPTAAGKTYFTKHLQETVKNAGLSTVTISTDEFYKDLVHLTMEERIKVNYDHPDSIDSSAFLHALEQLADGNTIDIPAYDFSTHTRKNEVRTVEPADLIIVEGIFSLSFEAINPIYDIRIFIDLDQDLRLIRRVRRDMKERGRSLESIFKQYLNQVRPSQEVYVTQDKILADLILLGNQDHRRILGMIQAAIEKKVE